MVGFILLLILISIISFCLLISILRTCDDMLHVCIDLSRRITIIEKRGRK